MLTSKQRAKLKGLANTIDTIGQVGKAGITDTVVKQADDALAARELIKMRALETAPGAVSEIAAELAEKTRSQVVQVIGSRFILYRRNEEDPKIEL